MREFEFIIEEALRFGLRSEKKSSRNKQVLTECFGFRIGKEGLEVAETIFYPFSDELDMYYVWPFPQFLQGEKYKILVVREGVNAKDVVYSLDNDYVATKIFEIDEPVYGWGGLMELADFGEYAILTNGVAMLRWDSVANDWLEVTSFDDMPLMKTICNFKGQLIGGNIVSDWYGCDETFIVWSKIGDATFLPSIRNEAGFRRDPFGGEVYHIKRLGDNVIVYSSKGITRMFPVQNPAATFGFEELHNVGIINQGAVNGNVNQHLFVDKGGYVWKIDRNAKLTYLGYEEFIDDDVIVSYSSLRLDFYICDDARGFLVSPNGMSEIHKSMPSIWYDYYEHKMLHREVLLGVEEPDAVEDLEFTLVSEIFDMGYRGSKTIFSVESGLSGTDEAEVAIEWRADTNSAFQCTEYTLLNNVGITSIMVAGIEFRLRFKVKALTPEIFDIDYFKIRWKMTDLRGLRGVYAAPPRGQS